MKWRPIWIEKPNASTRTSPWPSRVFEYVLVYRGFGAWFLYNNDDYIRFYGIAKILTPGFSYTIQSIHLINACLTTFDTCTIFTYILHNYAINTNPVESVRPTKWRWSHIYKWVLIAYLILKWLIQCSRI